MMHLSIGLMDFNWWFYTLSEYILHPVITLLLCLLSVFVVLGNLLVVSAIWHETQLHSVTNYLIASLAAADCLVGAVVMPFSVISEIIIGSWTFGATWCDLWHSFDVLASTASIMNLCAISLDRYLAITDPISYPSRMTPKRVALLIVFVWTVSSVISFPAIIWWRAVGPGPLQQIPLPKSTLISPLDLSASAHSSQIPSSVPLPSSFITVPQNSDAEVQLYRCVFTDDRYYLLFSSFVSFYGPLCIMLYAYYRIYKAAVQQTRFLKHGSKEVMIGRNKKAKRSRYLNDNIHGNKEKKGINDTSNPGPSNTGNYNRQHLVLRAHRGGGASGGSSGVFGGSGCTNSISKSSNGENNSMTNKNSFERKRRENQNFELVTSKNLIGSTTESLNKKERAQTPQLLSNDLDQSITSKIDCPRQVSKIESKRQNYSPNLRERIELTSSKRDKLRVECQRFDSKLLKDVPNSNIITSTTTTEATTTNAITTITSTSTTITIRNTENHYEEITNKSKPLDGFKTDSVNSSKKEVIEKIENYSNRESPSKESNGIKSGHTIQYTKQMGKPLIASINNRSTSVDVSIMNNSSQATTACMVTKTSAKEPSRIMVKTSDSAADRKSAYNTKRPPAYQTDSSFINVRHKCKRNKGGSLSCVIDFKANEESLEDVIGSGESVSSRSSSSSNSRGSSSDSGSDSSYGTGSIASVMTRSKQELQELTKIHANENSTDETNIKSNSDNRASEQGSQKLRRALSFGDSRNKEPWSKLYPHEKGLKNRGPSMSPNKTSNVSFDESRASCGRRASNRKSLDAISSFKTGKALNFRSWVKLTKSKRNDQDHITRQIKPPSSLLPLMMMNSDTSTDSSTVAGTIKRLDRVQEKGDSTKEGTQCQLDKIDVVSDHHIGCIAPTDNRNKSNEHQYRCQGQNHLTKQQDLIANDRIDSAKNIIVNDQKAKNHGFNDDVELGGDGRGKGQMLYYDSDKLIQSIVDLTAIHYIDCANQVPKHSEIHTECATDMIENEIEKSRIDATIDQVQFLNPSRANIPRQHRSMGKKLSKLAKERKAAKTLGIVVGVFILCWLPFFVVNIVIAICGTNSIYNLQIFVAIVTWLGWLNSAMNPVIYACWSRDFRRAFRRVLCTWVEFICPYDGSKLAKKLKLKKCSNYSAQETYLNRTVSSIKGNTSSVTTRSGLSIEGRGCNSVNGSVSRSLLSEQ